MDALKIAKIAAESLDDKKGKEVKIIRVEDMTTLADYFVFASASNSTQVKALADEVEYKLKENDILPDHIEGKNSNEWILLDYNNVVVHVFLDESRDFYKIEELWEKGTEIL